MSFSMAIALPQIPQLDLRDHFEAGEREGKGRKGGGKERKENEGTNHLPSPAPQINFWLRLCNKLTLSQSLLQSVTSVSGSSMYFIHLCPVPIALRQALPVSCPSVWYTSTPYPPPRDFFSIQYTSLKLLISYRDTIKSLVNVFKKATAVN